MANTYGIGMRGMAAFATSLVTGCAVFLCSSSGYAEPDASVGEGAEPDEEQEHEPERMRWDRPVLCLFDGKGEPIYAQCDAARKRCLFHRGCFGKTKGELCKPLERMKPCEEPAPDRRYEQLMANGTEFVPAIAEAPPGWRRDEAGRVFQTDFDMNRRVWLGGRWEPSYGPASQERLGRAVVEMGIRAEMLSQDTRSRYRFRALVGQVALNPLGVRGTAFRFDSSHESETPFLRFSTFWPEPRRHDLFLNVGWWVDVIGLEHRPRGTHDETHVRFAGAGGTWDLWHSSDMTSYFRLRLGAAFDDLYVKSAEHRHRLALTPVAALEADVIFDEAGMHRLTIASGYDTPVAWFEGEAGPPTFTQRFINSLAYETIVLAVNDQPITLRISGEGGYRDDVIEDAAGWEVRGGAGLRINFWAPPPDDDDRRRIAEVRGD